MNPRQSDIGALFAELDHAIKHVWENYLSHPFKKEDIFWETADNFMSINGQKIPRPNHGIVHTLRVAALIAPVVKFFKNNINPDYQEIMDRYDARRIKFLMLAALFSVVGRKDETGFTNQQKPGAGEKYIEYRKNSANAFNDYCQNFKDRLEITPEEIMHYTRVVKKMGDPLTIQLKNIEISQKAIKNPEESSFDYSILHLAHCLDLFRCANAERMYAVLFEKSELYNQFLLATDDMENDLENLMSLACRLIQRTGDRLMSIFNPSDENEDEITDYDNGSYHKKMYLLTALNPTEALNAIQIQLSLKPYFTLHEKQLVEYYERAILDLPHGPRQKTQATRDLEKICKALLSKKEINYWINPINEITVWWKSNRGNEGYNLSHILKNDADFEQLEFTDDQVKAYVGFLKTASIKPDLHEAESDEDENENNHLPTKLAYVQADSKNTLSVLSYAEKLAITLYCGNKAYKGVNQLLRSNGQNFRKPVNLIGEFLLLSAIATRGLMKLASRVNLVNVDFSQPPTLAKLYRVENLSGFNIKRQLDIKHDRVTLHKGFFSASRTEYIANEMERDDDPLEIIILGQKATLDQPSIEKISPHPDEEEHLYAPGSEVKYFLHLYDSYASHARETIYGVLVRTIDAENRYQYGTTTIRDIRWTTLTFLAHDFDDLIDRGIFSPQSAFDHYKKWLKAIAVTEEEFDYINKDILLGYQAFNGFSLSYSDLNETPLEVEDIFYFMQSILSTININVTALERLLLTNNARGLFSRYINNESVILQIIFNHSYNILFAPVVFGSLTPKHKIMALSQDGNNKGLLKLDELYKESLLNLEDLEKLIIYTGNHAGLLLSILSRKIYRLYAENRLTAADLGRLLKLKVQDFRLAIYAEITYQKNIVLTNYLKNILLENDDGLVFVDAIDKVKEMLNRYYINNNTNHFFSQDKSQLLASASALLEYFSNGSNLTEQQLALLKDDKNNEAFFKNYDHLLKRPSLSLNAAQQL